MFVSMGVLALQRELNIDPDRVKATKNKIAAGNTFATIGAAGLMALSNPFDIILILGVIPAMTESNSFTVAEILFIRGTTLIANITILIAYCTPLFLLRKTLNDRVLNKIRLFAAYAMIAIGGYIFVNMLTQADLYKTGLLG